MLKTSTLAITITAGMKRTVEATYVNSTELVSRFHKAITPRLNPAISCNKHTASAKSSSIKIK